MPTPDLTSPWKKTQSVNINIGGRVEQKLLTSHVMGTFSSLATHKRTSLINLKSIHGLSTFRDLVTQSGGGLVYHPGPNLAREYELSCAPSVDGKAILETAEYGAFQPGFAAELNHLMVLQNGQGLNSTQATMLLEIYRMYGLDPTQPLVVNMNNNTRTAGSDITQSITTNGAVTTVTREIE